MDTHVLHSPGSHKKQTYLIATAVVHVTANVYYDEELAELLDKYITVSILFISPKIYKFHFSGFQITSAIKFQVYMP